MKSYTDKITKKKNCMIVYSLSIRYSDDNALIYLFP